MAGMITPEDIAFAAEVVQFTPGSFLGGSYVVKGDEANDIDVIIPHAEWPRTRSHFSDRITKVRADIPTEQEDTADFEDDERLVTVYRRGHVDLIVVRDDYTESYSRAVTAMVTDPERFAERPARVAIHVFYADEVRAERGLPLEAEIKAARRRNGTFSSHGGGGGGLPEGYETP